MKNYLILLVIIFNVNSLFSQVGIGTVNPDRSSILDAESTNLGVLFPRMTTTQRDLISIPATGLLIYNITTSTFQYNVGTSAIPNWISLNSKATTQSGSYFFDKTGNAAGWYYKNVTFATPFTTIPSIQLTFREGTGVDSTGSYTAAHYKVANASTTGFTIAVYESSNVQTIDIYFDWTATLMTQ